MTHTTFFGVIVVGVIALMGYALHLQRRTSRQYELRSAEQSKAIEAARQRMEQAIALSREHGEHAKRSVERLKAILNELRRGPQAPH
jgi:hypothetical protein